MGPLNVLFLNSCIQDIYLGYLCLHKGCVEHNLIAVWGLGGRHRFSHFLSPPPCFCSLILRGKSWLWENSKLSVFSKRPLPFFSLPLPSMPRPVPPLTPALFPQCLAVCTRKEKSRVNWGHVKGGKLGAGGQERWGNENWVKKEAMMRGINSTSMRK